MLVRLQSSSLNPNLSPCQSSGNHSRPLFQKTIEDFDCKINGRALSSWNLAPAQLGQVRKASTNIGHFKVGSSRCQQWLVCPGKKCYHSCNTDLVESQKDLILFKFWAVLLIFFTRNGISMDLTRSCCRPKQHSLLSSILLQSFIGLWAKIRQGNKSACSKLNPTQSTQSSRSKSTTCQKKELMFRYQVMDCWPKTW